MRSLLIPSLHSLDSLYVQGDDLYLTVYATSATIINSQSTMDIEGTTSKIVTCSGNSPCTASIGNVCAAASSPLDGVVCSLPACPTIDFADHKNLKDNGGWNIWSASCTMATIKDVSQGKTVKIRKSLSMSGELVIDRGATSGISNRHFNAFGTLEMEDVTLKGGYAVSSFVLFVLL